jgi:hypothetical protein
MNIKKEWEFTGELYAVIHNFSFKFVLGGSFLLFEQYLLLQILQCLLYVFFFRQDLNLELEAWIHPGKIMIATSITIQPA